MPTFADSPALKLYALVAALTAVHMILLALWTGTVRVQRKQWVNPEDAKLNKGDQTEQDHPDVQRVKRAHPFPAAPILHWVFYLWGRQPFRTLMFATGVFAMRGMAFHVIRAAV